MVQLGINGEFLFLGFENKIQYIFSMIYSVFQKFHELKNQHGSLQKMPLTMGYFEVSKYLTIFPDSYSLFPGRRKRAKVLSLQGCILEGQQQSQNVLHLKATLLSSTEGSVSWGGGQHMGNKYYKLDLKTVKKKKKAPDHSLDCGINSIAKAGRR